MLPGGAAGRVKGWASGWTGRLTCYVSPMKKQWLPAALALAASAAFAQGRRDRPGSEHVFFKCKLLINPATGAALPDAVIETNGGKILRVGTPAEVPLPAGAKVIDYSDK